MSAETLPQWLSQFRIELEAARAHGASYPPAQLDEWLFENIRHILISQDIQRIAKLLEEVGAEL